MSPQVARRVELEAAGAMPAVRRPLLVRAQERSWPPAAALAGGLPLPVRRFAQGLFLLTAISLIFEGVCALAGMGYPYTSPLVARVSFFDDLLDWTPHMRLMHSAAFFRTPGMVAYTAPGQVLYWLLSLAGSHALAVYMVVAVVVTAGALAVFAVKLRRAGLGWSSIAGLLATMLVTSYPLAFMLTTANLELVLWGLLMAALWAYANGRHNLAVSLLGVAISMKLYPAVFLLLYLRRGQWWRIPAAAAVAAGTTIASLWAVYPDLGVAWRGLSSGAGAFVKHDCLEYVSFRAGFDHSLWSFYKTVSSPWITSHSHPEMLAVSLLCCGAVLWMWFGSVARMMLWERLTFLTAAMLLVMPMSNDYRLLQLYVPLGFLILLVAEGRVSLRLSVPAFACLALLVTAQGYVVAAGANFSAQLKCLALCGLAATVALWGRKSMRLTGRA